MINSFYINLTAQKFYPVMCRCRELAHKKVVDESVSHLVATAKEALGSDVQTHEVKRMASIKSVAGSRRQVGHCDGQPILGQHCGGKYLIPAENRFRSTTK